MEDDELYGVVEAIINATYSIQKSKFFRKHSVRLFFEDKIILPERITGDKDFIDQYTKLPLGF
jgi:hypothetical protein